MSHFNAIGYVCLIFILTKSQALYNLDNEAAKNGLCLSSHSPTALSVDKADDLKFAITILPESSTCSTIFFICKPCSQYLNPLFVCFKPLS
uniref:Uncharacterized protein n=1 Tax=Rhizophora mucronata TaxID=61149 RepID=A0A2P2IU71_RHIMU